MCKSNFTPKRTEQLGAVSTLAVPRLLTPWMLAYGAGTNGLRTMDEIRGRGGNYRHQVIWRTAEVSTDFPDMPWNTLGTVKAGNGFTVNNATPTAGKLWVQAGLNVSSSSGAGEALTSFQAMIVSSARVVGARTIQLQPDLNSGAVAYHLVTDAFPALGLSGVMVACIVSGLNGSLTYRPAIRYFVRQDEALGGEVAGGWTNLGTERTNISANERWNFGDMPTSASLDMWAQVAIRVSTAVRGTIQTIVAAKY